VISYVQLLRLGSAPFQGETLIFREKRYLIFLNTEIANLPGLFEMLHQGSRILALPLENDLLGGLQ